MCEEGEDDVIFDILQECFSEVGKLSKNDDYDYELEIFDEKLDYNLKEDFPKKYKIKRNLLNYPILEDVSYITAIIVYIKERFPDIDFDDNFLTFDNQKINLGDY